MFQEVRKSDNLVRQAIYFPLNCPLNAESVASRELSNYITLTNENKSQNLSFRPQCRM